MKSTNHSSSVESVLQRDDLFLVLVPVRFQLRQSSSQQVVLGLVVGQLLVVALRPLTLLDDGLVGVLEPAITHDTSHVSSLDLGRPVRGQWAADVVGIVF